MRGGATVNELAPIKYAVSRMGGGRGGEQKSLPTIIYIIPQLEFHPKNSLHFCDSA